MNDEELRALAADVQYTLVGRFLSNVRLGEGPILLIDFAYSAHAPAGKCPHLRIDCPWRIDGGKEVLVGSEDDTSDMEGPFESVSGTNVLSVSVEVPSFELRLSLEGGYRICVFPKVSGNSEYDNWTLHAPNKPVVFAGPDGDVRLTKADEI